MGGAGARGRNDQAHLPRAHYLPHLRAERGTRDVALSTTSLGMTSRPKLHFVYNVDATPIALVLDFVHRLLEPETYPCRLCDLTYGRFVKKVSWSRFVATLPVDSRFHLRGG